MAEEDTVTIDDHTILDETEFEPEIYEGGTLFSQSDMASVVAKLARYDDAIKEAIDAQRKLLAKISDDSDRTIGVEIAFRRLEIPDYAIDQRPVLIVTEKPNRTNVTITAFSGTGGSVFIGLHSGIRSPSGTVATSDVIEIVGSTTGNSRNLNTKRALWAVGESAQAITIDIVEEFA